MSSAIQITARRDGIDPALPSVFFGHGDADRVISAETTARASAWLHGHSVLTERVYAGLPHSISVEELGAVSSFLVEGLGSAG